MEETNALDQLEVERASIAALLSVRGVGFAATHRVAEYLIKHELSWSDFWVQSEHLLPQCGLSEKQIHSIHIYKKEHDYYSEYQSMKIRDIQVVLRRDPGFPVLLQNASAQVPALFVRSRTSLHSPRGIPVAVVGTRQATAYGSYVTRVFVQELVQSGCIVVSGGMYGIDVLAHEAALAAGGQTWVFLGHGFDHCYPERLRGVHERLAESGAVFWSPFHPGVRPSKQTFPMRNYVVAGCSAAVLVTEAAEESGSHITARCAIDEGRTVFAVPGAITNPYSAGTLALINQGAVLTLSGAEIVRELLASWGQLLHASPGECAQPANGKSGRPALDGLSSSEQAIMQAITSGLGTPALLAQNLDMPFSSLQQRLTVLELRGLISRKGGQLFLC